MVQKHFNETAGDAKDFIYMMRQKLVGRNLDNVLNMDQTPIPFSYHSSKMLDVKGLGQFAMPWSAQEYAVQRLMISSVR